MVSLSNHEDRAMAARPFEGWTCQIMQELGPIEYCVRERLNQPLVVGRRRAHRPA